MVDETRHLNGHGLRHRTSLDRSYWSMGHMEKYRMYPSNMGFNHQE
jgi:hypothetical protein